MRTDGGSHGEDDGGELERARRYYDRFSRTYEHARDGRSRYHDLLDDLEVDLVAPVARGGDLLEVGCGTGLLLRRFAAMAGRAVGVDLSPGMLAHARARGLDVHEGAAAALPFADATFDVVVSFKTLPHVPDLRAALAEMARVARPDGTLVVELYNPRSLRALLKAVLPAARVDVGTERDVLVRYDDRAALDRALPPGFHVVAARGIRTLVPAARVLELPLVGDAIERVERRIADTRFAAKFGGFVCYVLRRRDVVAGAVSP
jgi:ubiquinone/menaquinone biosynthesis C-methylase UbiE